MLEVLSYVHTKRRNCAQKSNFVQKRNSVQKSNFAHLSNFCQISTFLGLKVILPKRVILSKKVILSTLSILLSTQRSRLWTGNLFSLVFNSYLFLKCVTLIRTGFSTRKVTVSTYLIYRILSSKIW